MKKINCVLSISLLLISFVTDMVACDMCGCFMGILPSDRRSFGGIYYRYRSFSGQDVNGSKSFPDGGMKVMHTDHGSAPVPTDGYEIYRAVEFRARYYLHSRLQLNVILPYVMNDGYESAAYSSVHGIGDLSLLAGWQLIDEAETGKFRHRLLLGAGVKLPTGISDAGVNDERYPLMFQCGTGSHDLLTYATYQLAYDKLGLTMTPLFKFNGENEFNEKIDNSLSFTGSLFYKLEVSEQFQLLPSAQFYYENTKGEIVNSEPVKGTLMHVAMAGPGIDVYWKNLGLSFSAMYTVHEEENGSGLNSRIRYMLGVNLFFDQKKFVF